MLPGVSHGDYRAWGGTAGEGQFAASLPRAAAAVREMIGFNEPLGYEQERAYRAAVSAAVDVDIAHGGSAGALDGGFSIGSFSMGGSDGSGRSGDDLDMGRAVRRELVGTGLLYQGLG